MSTDQNDKKTLRPFANLDYKKTADQLDHFYDLNSFIKYHSIEAAPTKLVKDMTIEEKLEKAILMAKQKLNCKDLGTVLNHLSLNDKYRLIGKTRIEIKNDKEKFLILIITQILDRKPVLYPSSRNRNSSKHSVATLRKIQDLLNTGKIDEAVKLAKDNPGFYKKDLVNAIWKNDKQKCLELFAKFIETL